MTAMVTNEEKKRSYFREVQNELKKVSWPSKEELVLSTKAVVIATFVFGFTIYLADLLIRGVLDGAAVLLRLLLG